MIRRRALPSKRDSECGPQANRKCRWMQDLAVRYIFGAIGRKACQDATKFGKLLSRLVGLRNRPQNWGLYVWPPEKFYTLIAESS